MNFPSLLPKFTRQFLSFLMFFSLLIPMLARAPVVTVSHHQMNGCLKLLLVLFACRFFPYQFNMHTVIFIKHRHDSIISLPKHLNVIQIHPHYFLNPQSVSHKSMS